MSNMRRRYIDSSSSSGSSSSSDEESDATSSDSSDDELARYTRRRPRPQVLNAPPGDPVAKLQRLRRIFLNQPTARRDCGKKGSKARRGSATEASSPRREARQSTSPGRRDGTPRHSPRRKNSAVDQRHHAQEESGGSSSDEGDSTRIQLSIDEHIHSLCEQVKRVTVQRESTTSHMHTMLDQAIAELQFLKKREERSLQSQVKQIEESFTLRLEIFEQQYLTKVKEIKQEMQAAIEQQKRKCETTILTAAKQLKQKTQQLAVVPDLPAPVAMLSNVRSPCARSHSCMRSDLLPHKVDDIGSLATRSYRKTLEGRQKEVDEHGAETQRQLSPVSAQKAKLRALEAKLASFSQESVDRVSSELKSGRRKAQISNGTQARASKARSPSVASNKRAWMDQKQHDDDGKSKWKPTPLSPLRKNSSYWRNGISFEAKSSSANDRITANGDQALGDRPQPMLSLSSRFLLPQEEQELRHLRNSIGLAKDWMERHHH